MRAAFVNATPISSHRPGGHATPKRRCHQPTCRTTPPNPTDIATASTQLQAILSNQTQRVGNDDELAPILSYLEGQPSRPDCGTDARVLGVWSNLHTNRSPTASILQRTLVRSQAAVPAIQQVILGPSGSQSKPPPTTIVTRAQLRTLGAVLNVVAKVERVQGCRINLRFTTAWFVFDAWPSFLGGSPLPRPLRLPYPVPFRLLGDRAFGWQDITYLDRSLRITRGNRGSLFVLERVDDAEVIPGLDQVCAELSGAL